MVQNRAEELRLRNERNLQNNTAAFQRDDNDFQKGDEATGDLGASIATAVVGGLLLGPVGAVLLGGAQHLFTKKEKQGVLDRMAADGEALDQAESVFIENINTLRKSTDNPRDLEQLNAFQAQYESGMALAANASPEMQKLAAKQLGEAMTGINDYTVRQETQEIAAQTKEDADKRALGQQGYERFKDSRDNFTAESASYHAVNLSTGNLINALNRGTPVDQLAAVKLLEKTLDPQSVVRGSEAEAYGRLGSSLQQWEGFKNRLASGETLLPEQVKQMRGLALSINEEVYKLQLERETRFKDEITDIELPEQYHDNFQVAKEYVPPTPYLPNGDINKDIMTNEEIQRYLNGAN